MIPENTKTLIRFKNENHKILARIDWNITKDHKFTLRYNDVVGTSDQQTNSTSGPPNNARNSGRISSQSLAFSNAFYGFKNTVRSITGELNSNFGPQRSQINCLPATLSFRIPVQAIQSFSHLLISGRVAISICHSVMNFSAFNNNVVNKTLSFTDNVTINLTIIL